MDTFSENGTVLSYKLTEGNLIGDGNIWEFYLTDAHFNKFHSASLSIEKSYTKLCPKLPLHKIGGVVLDTHFYAIVASKFNRKSIKQSS